MRERVTAGSLQIDRELHDFIEREALPGTGIGAGAFRNGLARLAAEFTPRNRALVAKRDELQARIDAWHRERAGRPHDARPARPPAA